MRFRNLILMAALGIGACSNKESLRPPRPINLTRQEAMDVAFILAFWTDNASLARYPDQPVDLTVFPLIGDWKFNCFAGGTMLLEWRHNIKLNAGKRLLYDSVTGSLLQTSCTYVLENVRITAANDSAIKYTKTAPYNRGEPIEPFVLQIDGMFRWNTDDGRTGVCAIRYRQVFSISQQTFQQSGNVCGHDLDRTLPATRVRLKNMPWEVRPSG